MNNIIEKIKKNMLIKRTTTLLFMAILVAIFIGITIWINSLNLDPIDFTAEKLYTLTDTSKERVKDIQNDVNIFFVGYSDDASILDLAKQYHNANNKINVETVNPTERPDLVQKYGIETNSNGVIVESGQKSKILAEADFSTMDYATYEYIDITEEKLTNAILYVIAEKIPKVYFLEGYSEFSVNSNMSYLTMYLANEVTEYASLDLLTTGQIPGDCDTLIITTPSRDFDDIAYNAIRNYINNGGNILWFNAVVADFKELPNVNSILAMYGVKPFEKGYINEGEASQMMTGASNIILASSNYTPITKNIPSALMVNATRINFVSNEELQNLKITKTDLFKTSEKAFFRTNFNLQTNERQQGEEEGQYIVGAKLDKIVRDAVGDEKTLVSKLVIYGENLFISDYKLSQNSQYPMIAYSYNKDIPIDTIAYLVDRQEDIIIRKDRNTSTYTATVEQNNIVQTIIFGVPVVIILAGILVWQHRRRKR